MIMNVGSVGKVRRRKLPRDVWTAAKHAPSARRTRARARAILPTNAVAPYITQSLVNVEILQLHTIYIIDFL